MWLGCILLLGMADLIRGDCHEAVFESLAGTTARVPRSQHSLILRTRGPGTLFVDGIRTATMVDPTETTHAVLLSNFSIGVHSAWIVPRDYPLCPESDPSLLYFFIDPEGHPSESRKYSERSAPRLQQRKSSTSWFQCTGIDYWGSRQPPIPMGIAAAPMDTKSFDRSCWFSNVCYNPDTSVFNYYEDDSTLLRPPVVFDGKEWFEFPHDLVTLDPSVPEPWAPHVVRGRTPAAAHWSEHVHHVLIRPSYGYGWGDTLTHTIFSIWLLQELFGVTSADVSVLLKGDCIDQVYLTAGAYPFRAPELPHDQERLINGCNMNWRRQVPALSHVPPTQLSKLTEVTCFANLYVGTGTLSYEVFRPPRRDNIVHRTTLSNNHGRSTLWYQFRASIYANLDAVALSGAAIAQTVTFNYKGEKGTRSFSAAYVDAILQRIRDTFGPRLSVGLFYPKGLTFRAELAILGRTTVLYAHNGAMSFNCIFLPRGAAAIFLDVIYDQSVTPHSIHFNEEGTLFSQLAYVRDIWYVFGHDSNPYELGFNISQLLRLFWVGLEHAERSFGFQDSFVRPTTIESGLEA